MSGHVRSVAIGLAAGLVTLLLLDLARILEEAHARDGGETSVWWSIACYAVVGIIVAVSSASGARDRLAATVASGVVLLFIAPTLPLRATEWLPALPLVPSTPAQQVVAYVVLAAFATTAVRGHRRSGGGRRH